MIKTSPVYKEYTTFMQGVDFADHVRGQYATQTWIHKWWHYLFWFLIWTTVDNMWILHKEILKEKGWGKECLTHFKFLMFMCKSIDPKLGREQSLNFSPQ